MHSDRKTQQAAAAFRLKARSRWVLSGTPIQNKLDDLFSSLRFLRAAPFDEFDWFNRLVLRPIKYRDMDGVSRLHTILGFTCLRRMKDQQVRDLIPKAMDFVLMMMDYVPPTMTDCIGARFSGRIVAPVG